MSGRPALAEPATTSLVAQLVRFVSVGGDYWRSTQVIARWLAGAYNLPNHGDGRVPEYVKRWWFATHGERCSRCGWAQRREIDGRIPLTWDHIDGDCTNNRRENVRLLCPNCHALTETYGSLNKVSQRRRWAKPKLSLKSE